MVGTRTFSIATEGFTDIRDITPEVQTALEKTKTRDGTVTVFVSGSTAGVTTIEYEPGLLKDLPAAFERLAPMNIRYSHDDTWGDGNGFSHVRAALLGASLTVPYSAGKLLLGTWQQIVLIDFDNRPRRREVVLQFIGE